MTDVKTRTVWRMIDAKWIDTDPDVSVITIVLQSEGKEYVVVCSGPKGMKSDEFVPAIIAAGRFLNVACGDVVTDSQMADATFDTGDQRAN